MNPEIKTQWLDALRSGKYKQGKNYLKRSFDWDDQPHYCCLGVLCEIAAQEGLDIAMEDPEDAGYKEIWAIEDQTEILPEEVQQWAGMKDELGFLSKVFEFSDRNIGSLAELNDAGMTFPEIADIIEKEF